MVVPIRFFAFVSVFDILVWSTNAACFSFAYQVYDILEGLLVCETEADEEDVRVGVSESIHRRRSTSTKDLRMRAMLRL